MTGGEGGEEEEVVDQGVAVEDATMETSELH